MIDKCRGGIIERGSGIHVISIFENKIIKEIASRDTKTIGNYNEGDERRVSFLIGEEN